MSVNAIEQVLNELRTLAESDQAVVLDFLQSLKRKRRVSSKSRMRQTANPALKMKNGRLVFTGELTAPHIDWLHVIREERDDNVARQTAHDTTDQ